MRTEQLERADQAVHRLHHLDRVVPPDALRQRLFALEEVLHQQRIEPQLVVLHRDQMARHADEGARRVVLLEIGLVAQRLDLHGARDRDRVEVGLPQVEGGAG